MSNKTEQGGPKYIKCEHCGKFSVHHFNSKSLWFIGDEEDAQGGTSEFNGIEIQTDASVFTHICTNPDCGEMQDIGIEDPQELDFARQETEAKAKLLIKQLVTGTLPRELDHDWETYPNGNVNGICKKCGLHWYTMNWWEWSENENRTSYKPPVDTMDAYYFKVGKVLELVSESAPPCSGEREVAWWDLAK